MLGADFDNDSAFMNDVVVPWCRPQKIEVTRSRAYKKNDQAFVEQKNGAVVRRLVGYGRFEGVDTARMLARLFAASRLHTNFFQPSFKLKDKRREGAKVIKRYHPPATPYARALAHPCTPSPALDVAAFAKGLGEAVQDGEQRAIHRRMHKPYKTRVRMPSVLDPHVEDIERWIVAEPRLTALVILGRLAERCPGQFGPPQHTTVQRLLKAMRRKAATRLLAAVEPVGLATATITVPGTIDAGSSPGLARSAVSIASARVLADATPR